MTLWQISHIMFSIIHEIYWNKDKLFYPNKIIYKRTVFDMTNTDKIDDEKSMIFIGIDLGTSLQRKSTGTGISIKIEGIDGDIVLPVKGRNHRWIPVSIQDTSQNLHLSWMIPHKEPHSCGSLLFSSRFSSLYRTLFLLISRIHLPHLYYPSI